MPLKIYRWYTTDLLEKNRSTTFVFRDNALRVGRAGQALVCRHQDNTLGVATKWSPNEFFSDCPEAFEIVHRDLSSVLSLLQQGQSVGWPADGIGASLACLRSPAPAINEYLEAFFNNLVKYYRVKDV